MHLHDLMSHAARYSAGRVAVVDGAVRRSYRETGVRVERAGAGLSGLGLKPGSHVAVLAENSAFFFEAYFACARADLVVVPINIRLSQPETDFILHDSQCRALLYDSTGAALVTMDDGRVHIRADEAVPGSGPTWEQVIQTAATPLPPVQRDENATAHICYTGGTTGRAKGVMLSHRNVISSSFNKIILGGFARDDIWLHAAPMFHQADSWACFSFTALGGKHVFMPRFDANEALKLIDRHGVTALQLVPTMIHMLLQASAEAEYDLRSIRRILYSSAPMPVELLQRCLTTFGPVLQHIYGLTEAAGTIAAQPWPMEAGRDSRNRFESCGQPLPGLKMRIADADGSGLPNHVIGNIQVQGANIMQGYWHRSEETAKAFVDGWLDTGDLGRMDDDGFVYIVDRAKDMIISGGENVYSTEVEQVLHSHPAVLEAAVIGLPHEKWGEAVTAVVTARAGAAPREGELLAYCRQSLAGYKCPKAVFIRGELPKSAAGKILKPILRQELAEVFPTHRSEHQSE